MHYLPFCPAEELDPCLFFFSSRRRHTRSLCDWSSDVCSSDLGREGLLAERVMLRRRRCACDGLDRWVGEDGLERRGVPAELGRESRDPFLVRVDEGRQRTDFGVVADVVLPPRPAADDGDANAAGSRAARFRRRRARPAAPREGIHEANLLAVKRREGKAAGKRRRLSQVRFRSKTAGKVAQWAFAVKNWPG